MPPWEKLDLKGRPKPRRRGEPAVIRPTRSIYNQVFPKNDPEDGGW